MASDFEIRVLTDLGEIKAMCAKNEQANTDLERRTCDLEKYNDTKETRHWIKALVMGAVIVIAHPIARHLGWDV